MRTQYEEIVLKTKALNPKSESLKISASAVRFRPSPPPIFLPTQGNPPFQIPDNTSRYRTIPHIFWTQNGHSDKAGLNFKRKAKDLDGHKTGHSLRWHFLKIKKSVFLAILPILLVGCVFSAEKKRQINPWQELFPDQVERIYIIMEDRTFFQRTDHYENKIYVDIGLLDEDLRKIKGKKYSIKSIAIIIHNHLKGCRFSPDDRKQYRRLKRYGFKGFFLLYCHSTNKVYDIEDKKKSN